MNTLALPRLALFAVLYISAPHIALSQGFMFGVKGGTPISDSTLTQSVGSGRGIPSSGTAVLNVRRYTIGPTVEFALPFRLRFEADALYKRITQVDDLNFSNLFREVTHQKWNSWEFPLMAKYQRDLGSVAPFVLGGGSLRWVRPSEYIRETFAPPSYQRIEFPTDGSIAELGWVIGGGLRVDASKIKIMPELRYTRWKSERVLPTRNQVEFLLGIAF